MVGIVSDSFYLIKDTMDKFFRRNRRHLAKTKNQNFDPSELLLEDETLTTENMPKQAIIVPPVVENFQPDKSFESFDSFHSLSSDEELDQRQRSESYSEMSQLMVDRSLTDVTTRSGRVVRPPIRYGYED